MIPHQRRTKVVCTIGPASSGVEAITALVEAGMDAARLNFSHGTPEEHAARAAAVREAQRIAGRPLALIADLCGPKLRLGELPGPRELAVGERVTLTGAGEVGPDELPVSPPILTEVLRPGNEVLINDGRIRLHVDAVSIGRVTCTVVVGGPVSSHKGVNLPGVSLPVPSLTEKDVRDLEQALSLGVDYVALSFVRSPEDVRQLRERLHAAGSQARVIAKIEKAEAVEALEQIVEAADAVMVARGDLGVELGVAAVPLLQKRIILSALDHGKPVITATQMLESMIERPEPTRAEASDVANAILDGSAAVMLSGETAVGAYPAQSVRSMDTIARAVEPSLPYRHELAATAAHPFPTVGEAVTNAACDIAELLAARAILVPTYGGRTASDVARHRPRRPIIAVSHRASALQQLALEWGVVPLPIEQGKDVEHLWARALEAARGSGLVMAGDRVVITAGTAVNIPGTTDLIKVATA
ncbi:MAG: pyruvate kinase [Thermoleophilia bacterium]